MAKPKPGVCGSCGTAVVQPFKQKTYGWCVPLAGLPEPENQTFHDGGDGDWHKPSFGHLYEDGKLKRVLCETCAQREQGRPRMRCSHSRPGR